MCFCDLLFKSAKSKILLKITDFLTPPSTHTSSVMVSEKQDKEGRGKRKDKGVETTEMM